MYKFYHYVHCPYCIRVKMTLGYFKLDYKSIVLAYDDEQTPISLSGKKMLPIIEFPDGPCLNESLNIICKLDQNGRLSASSIVTKEMDSIDEFLSQIASPTHRLTMPYWMYTPEFDQNARKYFQTSKERKKGPFSELARNKNIFIKEISQLLKTMEGKLTPYFQENEFTLKDILIAAHLWGLYIVPEFQFSPQIHNYLQSVASLCSFNYHEDFWREDE